MADRITNYQCPACTGPLRFDPVTGKLVCDHCGSSYSTEEIEALYAETDEAAAQAAQAAEGQEAPEGSSWSEAEAAGLKVDYVECVDAVTLAPRRRIEAGTCVLVAAYAGRTRLIDNRVF